MKTSSVFALSAALVMSAACKAIDSLITVPQSQPIATISMNAQAKGGGFVTSPGAFFYRVVAGSPTIFTSVGTVGDTCQQRQAGVNTSTLLVDTLPVAASPISAGAFVAMQLSGHADTLLPPGAQSAGYHMAPGTSHAFTPGDTVTFTIPGSSSGFPSTSVSLRTAEAFTMTTVTFAQSGQDMPVTWTPATVPGSVLNFTITYASGSTPTQIFCQFVDDGHASVPAVFFTTFPNATPGNPVLGVNAIRMRAGLIELPSGSILNVVSTFEFPTPISP